MGFKMINWTFMSGSYLLYGSKLKKCGFFFGKTTVFRADMAGLGRYHMGGYGRIGSIGKM